MVVCAKENTHPFILCVPHFESSRNSYLSTGVRRFLYPNFAELIYQANSRCTGSSKPKIINLAKAQRTSPFTRSTPNMLQEHFNHRLIYLFYTRINTPVCENIVAYDLLIGHHFGNFRFDTNVRHSAIKRTRHRAGCPVYSAGCHIPRANDSVELDRISSQGDI